jgi:lipopolysaccharide/colanic/teichoic acid biosynthesis glycosyltransferase
MVEIMAKRKNIKNRPGGGYMKPTISTSAKDDPSLGGREVGTAVAVMSRSLGGRLTGAGPDALNAKVKVVKGDTLTQDRLPGAFYLGVKRVFDIAISIFALAIFGLMLPVLTLIIKLDSPGPVFYSQERVGLNRRRPRNSYDGPDRRKVLQPGRPFKVFKLRTMGANAEAAGPQLAKVDDVRITRVGRFLRRSRLDEVPQFLNVLRGEMSLIGPRPERMVFVRQWEKDIPNYKDRLLVLPGITGLAQVINGYDDGLNSVRRKVELDREYIKKAGFRQDGNILLSTVSVVLKGDGAR